MLMLQEKRRIVDINIDIAYPKLDTRGRKRLRQRHFQSLGHTILELGPLWKRDINESLQLITEVNGADAVDSAFSEGRGLVLFTAHFGAWEAVVLYIAHHWPFSVLYKKMGDEALNATIISGRSRSGAKMIPKNLGIRPFIQTLMRHEAVGILPDQNVDEREGVYAPFFGRPASTSPIVSRLALRNSTPTFGVFATRLPKCRGIRLDFVPMPSDFPSGDDVTDTFTMNQIIERAVRSAPEQYWWVHRRFKAQPKGYKNPYD